MQVSISALKDTGKERPHNEDNFIFCPDVEHPVWDKQTIVNSPLGNSGAVIAVADGMGGTNAGEVASAIATQMIKKCFSETQVDRIKRGAEEEFLHEVFKETNTAILNHAKKDPNTMGMGTTLVLSWILQDKVYVAWCGDSRCYVFNPKSGLKRLTKDHSYVQELVDNNVITEQQAFNHADANIITRALGDIDATSIPDIITYDLNSQDVLLLCSDGLCGYCSDRAIETLLFDHYHDINRCSKELLELALNEGGYDNICIALASVHESEHQDSINQSFFRRLMSFIIK